MAVFLSSHFFFIALFSHSFFVRSFVCVFVQQPPLLLFAVIEAFVSFCHSSTPRSMFSLLCIHGIYNRGSHRVYLPNRQKHKNKIICRMQFISSSNVLSSAVTAKHLRFCQHILLSHYSLWMFFMQYILSHIASQPVNLCLFIVEILIWFLTHGMTGHCGNC